MAFSISATANEIEEKKVEALEEAKERDCFLEADMTLRVWDAVGGTGLTEEEEIRFMNIYIARCEGYPESSIIN